MADERVVRVKEFILATRHSALRQGQDQQFLVDPDLSILGADGPRFEEYERQVREVYGWVAEVSFVASGGRRWRARHMPTSHVRLNG